jgi:hypothetical protein
MLISDYLVKEYRKLYNLVEAKKEPSSSITNIPIGLINDIDNHLIEEIMPKIFSYIDNNNIDFNEFVNNTKNYALDLYENVIDPNHYETNFDLLTDENLNFVQDVLINKNIINPPPFKLVISYFTSKSVLWDDFHLGIESDLFPLTSLGMFKIIQLNEYEGKIECAIVINIDGYLRNEVYEAWKQSDNDYYYAISELNLTYIRTTIRHELEHYYNLSNRLIKNITRYYNRIINDENESQYFEEDVANKLIYFLKRNIHIKGYNEIYTKTNYFSKFKAPFKSKSDLSYLNKAFERNYLYKSEEIITNLNDFVLFYTRLAKMVFKHADDAIIWLRQFLNSLNPNVNQENVYDYLNNELRNFLSSGQFFKGKEVSDEIFSIINRKNIRSTDLQKEEIIELLEYFIHEFCLKTKLTFLFFLKEIFIENTNYLLGNLKSNINQEKYIKNFKEMKFEYIKMITSKIHKSWNDPNLNIY